MLEASREEQPKARYSLRKCALPTENGTQIRWQAKSLGIQGTWQSLDPPCDARIYECSEGSVEWHCVQPRARCEVHVGNGMALRGLGYVERLEMTVAPWSLPLEELRWGRFLSDSDSLVWIDWRGPHSRRVVAQNGIPRRASAINEREIVVEGDGRLELSEGHVLRQGLLGETALAVIPGLQRMFPSSLLNVQECKWRSRAKLLCGEGESSGWAIHEVVRWPK